MDETRQLYDGPKQETRNAIDALGADLIRCATEVEAQLKRDVRTVESRFEKGHVKDYDEFFYETMFHHVATLAYANAALVELVERNKKLYGELMDWLARLHEAKREAAELNREGKPEPTTD
jgi:hypothetical protein